MMKVLIIGSYGERNLGDDALMYSIYRFFLVNIPDADIVFTISSYSEYLSALCPGASFLLKRNINYSDFDYVIYGGGTQFFNFKYDERESMAIRILRKSMNYLRDGTLVDRVLNKFKNQEKIDFSKFLALGLGVGPFVSKKSASIVHNKLSQLKWVSLRDSLSVDYAKNWGLECFHSGADICFNSELWLTEGSSHKSQGNGIAVIVRDWTLTKDRMCYLSTLLKASKNGFLCGRPVTYLVFSDERDKESISMLNECGITNKIVWSPSNNCSISDFSKNVLSGFDLVISARYHGVVLSAIMGVPGIAVGLDPKLRQLKLDLPGVQVWEPPYDEKDLFRMIEEYFKNEDRYKTKIENSCQENKKKSKLMFDSFRGLIVS